MLPPQTFPLVLLAAVAIGQCPPPSPTALSLTDLCGSVPGGRLRLPVARPGILGFLASLWSRIVNGNEAAYEEFPFIAALYARRNASDSYRLRCGGSVISGRYVLTAAHCITTGNVNDFLVSLGQWDLKATDAGEKIFAVEKALAHPNYTGDVSDGFDVGLLRLSSSIAFDRYIQPICVPRGDTEKGIKCQNAVVYGWGRLSTDGEIPSTLRKAEMTVTSQSKCKLKGIITDKQDRFVCAKGAGNDNSAICLGDSGGPLATVYNGVYYLTGVVSYLKKSCGLKGVPDVFSRTSAYAEWISANAK